MVLLPKSICLGVERTPSYEYFCIVLFSIREIFVEILRSSEYVYQLNWWKSNQSKKALKLQFSFFVQKKSFHFVCQDDCNAQRIDLFSLGKKTEFCQVGTVRSVSFHVLLLGGCLS